MSIPFLDLRFQYTQLKDESDALWFEIMENSAFVNGPKVEQFEQDMADYCDAKYCIAVANGTDALFLILHALGIKEGDEVITTPWTFFATVESIAHVGATPVLVDIESGTYNIDVSKIEEKITEKTRAIMPVHIYGQCVDMGAIKELAEKYNLFVIEDACQAIGADYKGTKAGGLGDAAAFSFFPTKNLGCAGDGGAITTNNKELADKIRLLARHGEASKYIHTAIGYNSRLDALQAGLLSLRLSKLDEWNEQRRAAASYYLGELEGVGNLELPQEREYGKGVFHLFILKSPNAPDIVQYLQDSGVGSALYYPKSLHEQDILLEIPGYIKPSLPVAEDCASKTLAIPCFPGITKEQLETVVVTLRRYFS